MQLGVLSEALKVLRNLLFLLLYLPQSLLINFLLFLLYFLNSFLNLIKSFSKTSNLIHKQIFQSVQLLLHFAHLVLELVDTILVLIEPLSQHIRRLRLLSRATVLGRHSSTSVEVRQLADTILNLLF